MNNKIEKISKDIKKNLRTYVLDAGLAIVSIGFTLYNLLRFEKSNVGVFIAIATGVASFIASVIIKALLGEKGFALGYANADYIKRHKKYVKRAELAEPFNEKADEFINKKRDEKKHQLRKVMLVNNRMHYETFFDEQGEYLDPEIENKEKIERLRKKDKNYVVPKGVVVLDKHQRRILKKVIALKIYIPDLFTEYEDNLKVYTEKERTDKEVRMKNNGKNTILGALITFVGVSFTATIVFNWGKILSTIFMLAMYFGFGIIQLYSNFTYITVEKVNILDKKEPLLHEFLRENMSKEEYDEKIKHIKEREKLEEYEQPKVAEQPKETPKKEEFIEVEMTEEELKEKGLI